jgi:hypothetical protein
MGLIFGLQLPIFTGLGYAGGAFWLQFNHFCHLPKSKQISLILITEK